MQVTGTRFNEIWTLADGLMTGVAAGEEERRKELVTRSGGVHAHPCVCTCVSSCRSSGGIASRSTDTGMDACQSESEGEWTEWMIV